MKNRQGKLKVLVIVVMIVLNIAFAYFYNSSVRQVVSEVAYNDYISLQSQNALIIGKLKEFDDSSRWNEILEEYEEFIMIFDKDGNVVANQNPQTQNIVTEPTYSTQNNINTPNDNFNQNTFNE